MQIGFVRLFDEEWLDWRSALKDNCIGCPVVWRDIAAVAAGPPDKWFHEDAQGGGPFLDGCIHSLDFGLFTFGPIDWVFCHGRTMKPAATAIDTGSATVRFMSGDELQAYGLVVGIAAGNVAARASI